jgi:hypothetical protein
MRTLALLTAASTVSVALWAGIAQASNIASSARPAPQPAAALDEIPAPVAAVQDTTGETGTDDTPDVKGECPQFNFCLWKDAGWGDPFWSADFFTSPHNVWISVGSGLSGKASSLWNKRDTSTLIRDPAGLTACIRPHTWYRNLAKWHWPGTEITMNNSISVIQFADPLPCVIGGGS